MGNLMRNLINAALIFLVFWLGSDYFSEYLYIADTKTLILATVLMFVIGYVFSFAMLLSILTIPLGVGCITTIILFCVALILTPVKLWLLDNYLVGFDINGFWTYVVLTIVLSIFSMKVKANKNGETYKRNQFK